MNELHGVTKHYPFSMYHRFHEWLRLEAWGREIEAVLWVKMGKDQDFTGGHAYHSTKEIYLILGRLEADACAVLLHEMAHIADDNKSHHGSSWKTLYMEAVEEVTGRPVVPKSLKIEDIDWACTQAFVEAPFVTSAGPSLSSQ